MAIIKGFTIAKLIETDLNTISMSEARRMARSAKTFYATRKKSILSSVPSSPAIDYYEKNFINKDPIFKKPVKDLTLNQTRHMLKIYQYFFQAKTSNKSAALKLWEETEKKIFGVDEKGKPKKFLSGKDAAKFWELYREFQSNYNEDGRNRHKYDSDDILAAMGEFTDFELGASQMAKIDEKAYEIHLLKLKNLSETENNEVLNAYSGTGTGLYSKN